MSEIVSFSGEVSPPEPGAADSQAQLADFLTRVGSRVRAARARLGWSRRELADRSGLSQRFLAQLEAGQGNISIGRLLDVARALDFGIEWLVAADDPWGSEVARASFLMQKATRAQRAAVFEILAPEQPRDLKARRIALIGLRGAGKSTLGRMAAEKLGLAFLELTAEVEQAAGMPAAEIIALYGQDGYRQLEADALERLIATHDEVVLAVGGGIIAQPETFDVLLRHFHTVWLAARPEDHMERVRAQGDLRPMAGLPNALQELRAILGARAAQYGRADLRLNTSGKTVPQAADRLVALIRPLASGGMPATVAARAQETGHDGNRDNTGSDQDL